MKLDKEKKKLILALVLTGLASFVFSLSSRVHCQSLIRRWIRVNVSQERLENATIYILQDISLCCRPCYQYDRYRREDAVRIYLVGFSVNDRDNFIEAFGINPAHKIEFAEASFESRFLTCLAGSGDNYMILLDSFEAIREIRRF